MNQKLLDELRSLVGPSWVLTTPGELAAFSFDSALDRGIPTAVILPANSTELIKVTQALVQHRQIFVTRGAGTSLCGGPVPALPNTFVVGTARLKHIGKLDRVKNEIFVGPGVVNLKLQDAVAVDKLFFAPDPGSQKASTVGGNVATNAGGPHCLKYGVTSNNIAGLDLVLPNGQSISLRVNDPGYDLISLFVGSEGTLGVVAGITVKLLPSPEVVKTMVVSFNSIEEAIQSVSDIIAAGILPATLEAMDKTTVAAIEAFMHAGYPLEAEAVLLIEVDGNDRLELESQIDRIKDVCERNHSFQMQIANDEKERKKLWEGRRGAYAAMARLAPNVLVEDGAVPRTKLPDALREIKNIAEEEGLQVALLFHAGDGNLHPQIIFDERDENQTKVVKRAGYRMLKACVDLGGTISGEHGIGIDKREAMKWLFSRETLSLFRRIKLEFDPQMICNPDKLIPLVSKGSQTENQDIGDPSTKENLLGMSTPSSEEEALRIIRQWGRDRKQFGIQGSGTKFVVTENQIISTKELNKIIDFDRGNLTITVQAGASMADVRAHVEAANQYLWVAGEGTVGGVIATKASHVPPLRDQILGMKVLLPTGELVQFGAKTMKNVAGYDAAKLLIDSWGTLGIIIEVIFRLFPTPAPKISSGPVKPFALKEIHKKIKRAFDPAGILSNQIAMMSAQDIELKFNKKNSAPSAELNIQKQGDEFWKQ